MNTKQMDADRLSDAQRLEMMGELLAEVVPGIRTIQEALQESEDLNRTGNRGGRLA